MTRLCFELPDWLASAEAAWQGGTAASVQLAQTIALSQRNSQAGGGPFAAAILDVDGQLLGLGVNRVIASGCSHWHAEMVAIARAQQRLGYHDLSLREAVLYSSCEPCAMCIGGILWSGIRSVFYAATDTDAREVGFDEGPKAPDWPVYFHQKGILVSWHAELQPAARAILQAYVASGQPLY